MQAHALTHGPVTISQMPAGAHGVVHTLLGGCQFGSRLADLGFTTGAIIQVRQNYGHGPVLVTLRGALIALGRAEASKVLVQAEV